MVEKPNVTRIWASGAAAADIVDPDVGDPGKFAAGWTSEIPPYEHFNFLQKLFTQMFAHINERGIAAWDANTQYLTEVSYVQRGGQIYRARTNTKGNDPASSPNQWAVWPERQRDIPVGSRMLFAQANAPVGWTKITEHNNKALRVVSGTGGGSGGSTPFTTALNTNRGVAVTVNNHTLTVLQIPPHQHQAFVSGGGNQYEGFFSSYRSSTGGSSVARTLNEGGGQGHNHSASGSFNLNVQYVDIIIAERTS